MATVYIHRRKDIEDSFLNVFYVGISKHDINNSKYVYRPYSKTRNSEWKKLVFEVLNGEFDVEIAFERITIEEAYQKEIELIEYYGRVSHGNGNLVNQCKGGKTISGLIYSEEQLMRKKLAAIECNNREGARERMSLKLKEITSSPEKRKKMSLAAYECNNRPEVKRKISAKSKEMHQNEEFKKKHREATHLALLRPEVRKKNSESQKIAQNKPEVKERVQLGLKKYHEDEEYLKRKNKSIKNAWEKRNERLLSESEICTCSREGCNNTFKKVRSFKKYCSYLCGQRESKKRIKAKKYAL